MRREERHHLKENDLASFILDVMSATAGRERTLVVGLVVIVGVIAAGGGYVWWQGQQEERAGALLAEGITVLEAQVVPPPESTLSASGTEGVSTTFEQPPGTYPSLDSKLETALPRLLEAADNYPSTPAGVTARYHAATVLAALGRPEESATQYEEVAAREPETLHGQMANLGLAESYLATGRHTDAIAVLEQQTAALESLVPLDAVLMRLGQAYRLDGQSDQALAAFTRVVEEFPLSVYSAEAQDEVDLLRQEGATSDG